MGKKTFSDMDTVSDGIQTVTKSKKNKHKQVDSSDLVKIDTPKNDNGNSDRTKEKKLKKHKRVQDKFTDTKKRKPTEEMSESSPLKKTKLDTSELGGHGGSEEKMEQNENPENEQSTTKNKGRKDWKKKWEEKNKKKKKDKAAKKEKQKQRSREVEYYLEYLSQWQNDRSAWRFNKHRQTWLLNHMYDSDKVPDESFSILLTYMEGSAGQARTMTSQKAEKIMKAADENEAMEEEQDEVSAAKQARARQVLQRLTDAES